MKAISVLVLALATAVIVRDFKLNYYLFSWYHILPYWQLCYAMSSLEKISVFDVVAKESLCKYNEYFWWMEHLHKKKIGF